MDVGPGDARGVRRQDDGAVHLGQLTEALGAEFGVEEESAGADREHGGVVADDDQCPVLGLENAINPLAQRCPGRDQGKGVVQRLTATLDHARIVSSPAPLVTPQGSISPTPCARCGVIEPNTWVRASPKVRTR